MTGQRHASEWREEHRHQKEVTGTEHQLLDHLLDHDPLSGINKELNHLKHFDAKHGHSFPSDLTAINVHLQKDEANQHLPQMTIVEDGQKETVKYFVSEDKASGR